LICRRLLQTFSVFIFPSQSDLSWPGLCPAISPCPTQNPRDPAARITDAHTHYAPHPSQVFDQILCDRSIEKKKEYKEMVDFVRWVVREYFKLALQSPCLFVEPITWTKSHKDAELIQRGYGPEEAKPARRVRAGPLSFSSSIHGGHTVLSLCPVSFLYPSLFLCVETLRSLCDLSTFSRCELLH